jgi:hypothetical protein
VKAEKDHGRDVNVLNVIVDYEVSCRFATNRRAYRSLQTTAPGGVLCIQYYSSATIRVTVLNPTTSVFAAIHPPPAFNVGTCRQPDVLRCAA